MAHKGHLCGCAQNQPIASVAIGYHLPPTPNRPITLDCLGHPATRCPGVSHSKGVHSKVSLCEPPLLCRNGALFVGDGVSLPIPPQFGCDECILTHITWYLNQKRGKSRRAKLVGSSWYLTPLLWDTPLHPSWGLLMDCVTCRLGNRRFPPWVSSMAKKSHEAGVPHPHGGGLGNPRPPVDIKGIQIKKKGSAPLEWHSPLHPRVREPRTTGGHKKKM